MDNLPTRVCVDCKTEQPIGNFLPVKRGIYSYRDNRCDECRRIACICRNLVITPARYREIVAASGGVCLICHRTFGPDLQMVIDHRHATGHLRSAICCGCNTGIGLFQDNPETLEAAAAYLRQWQERNNSVPIDEACVRREQNMEKIRWPVKKTKAA